MLENKDNSLMRSKKIVIIAVAALLVILLMIFAGVSIADKSKSIENVLITNITDTAFTVVWTSKNPTNSKLVYKEGNDAASLNVMDKAAYDDRDSMIDGKGEFELTQDVSRYTHHVTVRNLKPNTKYTFALAGTIFTRQFPVSVAETKPLIAELNIPDPIYGKAQQIDANDSLIIMSVKDADDPKDIGFTSTTISPQGTYTIDLNALKVNNTEINSAKDLYVQFRNKDQIRFPQFTSDGLKPLETIIFDPYQLNFTPDGGLTKSSKATGYFVKTVLASVDDSPTPTATSVPTSIPTTQDDGIVEGANCGLNSTFYWTKASIKAGLDENSCYYGDKTAPVKDNNQRWTYTGDMTCCRDKSVENGKLLLFTDAVDRSKILSGSQPIQDYSKLDNDCKSACEGADIISCDPGSTGREYNGRAICNCTNGGTYWVLVDGGSYYDFHDVADTNGLIMYPKGDAYGKTIKNICGTAINSGPSFTQGGNTTATTLAADSNELLKASCDGNPKREKDRFNLLSNISATSSEVPTVQVEIYDGSNPTNLNTTIVRKNNICSKDYGDDDPTNDEFYTYCDKEYIYQGKTYAYKMDKTKNLCKIVSPDLTGNSYNYWFIPVLTTPGSDASYYYVDYGNCSKFGNIKEDLLKGKSFVTGMNPDNDEYPIADAKASPIPMYTIINKKSEDCESDAALPANYKPAIDLPSNKGDDVTISPTSTANSGEPTDEKFKYSEGQYAYQTAENGKCTTNRSGVAVPRDTFGKWNGTFYDGGGQVYFPVKPVVNGKTPCEAFLATNPTGTVLSEIRIRNAKYEFDSDNVSGCVLKTMYSKNINKSRPVTITGTKGYARIIDYDGLYFLKSGDCNTVYNFCSTRQGAFPGNDSYKTQCYNIFNSANSIDPNFKPLKSILAEAGTNNTENLTIKDSGRYAVFKDNKELYSKDIATNDGETTIFFFDDLNGDGIRQEGEKLIENVNQFNLQKEAEVVNIDLSVGWNLINLPLVDNRKDNIVNSASKLANYWDEQGAEVTSIARFSQGKFQIHTVREVNDYSDDFPLIPGEGLFVFSHTNASVTFSGAKPTKPVAVTVNQGWNLLGFPVMSDNYKSSSLLKEFSDQGITADTASQFESGLYSSVILQKDANKQETLFGNDFNIINKKGYFIRIEDGGGKQFLP
jgi:hypothetical protein